jgi:hypothetical protein
MQPYHGFISYSFMQIHNIEPLHSFFFNYFLKIGTCQVSMTWIVWWRGLLWLIEHRTFAKLDSMWLILASFIPTCACVWKSYRLIWCLRQSSRNIRDCRSTFGFFFFFKSSEATVRRYLIREGFFFFFNSRALNIYIFFVITV